MSYPSVPNSFTNGVVADGPEVNANFTALVNGLSDGTKQLNVLDITLGNGSVSACAVGLGGVTTGFALIAGAVNTIISGTSYVSVATTGVTIGTAIGGSYKHTIDISTTGVCLGVRNRDTTNGNSTLVIITGATAGTGDLLSAYNNAGAARLFQVSNVGNVTVGSAALSTTATDGFLYIASCAGAPTGVPTAQTGRTPMIFDTTNNKFYIYDGGWLGVTLS